MKLTLVKKVILGLTVLSIGMMEFSVGRSIIDRYTIYQCLVNHGATKAGAYAVVTKNMQDESNHR